MNGALFANWVARVPAVKDAIDAGNGTLGVALLGIAVGSLVTMPFAGRLCERYTSRATVIVSGLAASLGLFAVAWAGSPLALAGLLALYGASFGLLDVAMNVQAVAVVRLVERPVMPWFHAAFSLGGLVGAPLGGWAAGAGWSVQAHFAVAAAAAVGVVLLARPHLLPERIPAPGGATALDADGGPGAEAPPTPGTPRPRRISLVVLGLGAIATCAAIGEGAMADWSALFLRDVRGVTESTAALGFAAFSITMTGGRLGGEAAIRRLGPVRALRLGGLVAAAGLVLAVAVPAPAAGLAGFGLVGLGMCYAFPLALTTAGESSPGSGGREIAAVSVIGYLGFLAGPPVIGLLADQVELRWALLAVTVPAVGLVLLAPVLRRAQAAAPAAGLGRMAEPVSWP